MNIQKSKVRPGPVGAWGFNGGVGWVGCRGGGVVGSKVMGRGN